MGQAEIKDNFIKELYIQDHELEFLLEDGIKRYYSCEDNNSSKSIVLHCLPREEEGFRCEGNLGELPVKRGVNTFSVRITKEETVVKEYTISIVVKASPADVTLKALLVDDQEAVIPKDGEYYYYRVGADCTRAEVEAIPSDPQAEVEGDLGIIDLETGMNFFLIRVYSADRSNKASYQLAIEREGGEDREKDKGTEERTIAVPNSQMGTEEAWREEAESVKPEPFLMEDRAEAAHETGGGEAGERAGGVSGHGERAGEGSRDRERSGEVSGNRERSGEVSGNRERPGEVSRNRERLGEVSGNRERLGEVSGNRERPGEVSRNRERSGEVSGNRERLGEVSGNRERPGEVSRNRERPGEVSRNRERLGEVSGNRERPGEVSGNRERPGEVSRNRERSGEVSGNRERPGEVSGNRERPGEVSGHRERSGEVSGNRERSGEVSGNRERSGEVSRNRERSGEVSRNRERSGEVSGNRERSGEVSGNRERPGEVSGHHVGSGEVSGHRVGSGEVSGHRERAGEVSGYRVGSGEASENGERSREVSGHRERAGEVSGYRVGSGEASGNGERAGEVSGYRERAGEVSGYRVGSGEASGNGERAGEVSGHRIGAGEASGFGGGGDAEDAYDGRMTELVQDEAWEASGYDENAQAFPGGEDALAEEREEGLGVSECAAAEEFGGGMGLPGDDGDAAAEEARRSGGASLYDEDDETAEYGKNKDTTAHSSESRLSDLKVEGGSLKPEFSPDVFDYRVNFQGEISEEILVEAVPLDLNAAVDGDMGIQGVVTGFNAFSVLCTAPDGVTKSLYKYSVEKRKPKEAKAVKKSGRELKEKKKDYKKKVWKARMTKLKAAVGSKSEKKVTLKQSQKIGIILIILLCANYPVYVYSTKPAMEKRTTLGTEAAEVSARRGEVEERLFKKDETEKNISDGEERLVEIGNKYPHFPSQEEILYYLDSLQKRVPILYTATFIGEPTAVQSADILTDIASKNIGTVIGDLDLLTPPGPAEAAPEAAADGSPSGNGEDEASQAGQFRRNVLTVTLQGSKENVLKAYEDFIGNQRLIVADDIQFSGGVSSNDNISEEQAPSEVWSLSFSAYYYQYTSLKERSY